MVWADGNDLTPTNLNNKGSLVFNVLDSAYGAVADGSTDDSAAIQAAIDAANTAGNGTVLIPRQASSYVVKNTVTLKSNVKIVSDGATIEHAVATEEDVLYGADLSNVEVRGLRVNGRKDLKAGVGTSTGRGIHLESVHKAIVEGCHIINCYEHGLRVGDTPGAGAASSSLIHIINNVCKDNGNSANERGFGIVCFWDMTELVVMGNQCVDNRSGGIFIDDVSSDATANKEVQRITVVGNIVQSAAANVDLHSALRGINLEGCQYFTVANNVVLGEMFDGILISDGQADVWNRYGVVSGNYVDVSAPAAEQIHGIRVLDSIGVLVSGNLVRANGSGKVDGINISTADADNDVTADVLVAGNLVASESRGISTELASATRDVTRVTISGNDVRTIGDQTANSDAIGIRLILADGVRVQNNVVRAFYDNINVASSATNSIISDNLVFDAGDNNINLGIAAKVLRNYSSGSTNGGFRIEAAANTSACVLAYNYSDDSTATVGTITNVVKFLNNFIAAPTYTPSSVSTDRAYDADSTTLAEVADVLGTLIADLQALGVLA